MLFFPLRCSKQSGFPAEGSSQKYFSLLKLTINSSLFLEGQTPSFDTGTRLASRPVAILLFRSSSTYRLLQMKYCQYKSSTHCLRKMRTEYSFTLGEMLRAQAQNSHWILMLQCTITASFCFHAQGCQSYQRYFSSFFFSAFFMFAFFFEIAPVKQMNLKQLAVQKQNKTKSIKKQPKNKTFIKKFRVVCLDACKIFL